MDCRKRTRASALFQFAIDEAGPRFEGDRPAFRGSTDTNPNSAALVQTSGKPDQITTRNQQRYRHHGVGQAHKLPARVMPAVLPAILLFCCVFVWLHTAHGQAPQEIREAGVQQLIKQLAQVDFDQREEAERKLVEIGSPVVEPLIGTLPDCTPDVCSRVKRILQAVAGDCDEESLFKILAALQIRFEAPAERIEFLLDSWTVQRRQSAVARWRKQGAIVEDPYADFDLANERDEIERQILRQKAQQDFRFNQQNGARSRANERLPETEAPKKRVITQPIAERLQFVLGGSLEQNKELVLSSNKGPAGFESSLNMLQKKPVLVTIGEDWQGEDSVFDVAEGRFNLLIGNLVVQKREVNNALLSVLRNHPLISVTFNECSICSRYESEAAGQFKIARD